MQGIAPSSLKGLHKPFHHLDVKWRIQAGNRCVCYLDARIVAARLDEVLGCQNWQNEFFRLDDDTVMCRLGIRIECEWVYKQDGAPKTGIEGEKGAISDAFKRAAVQWGIGRYLYGLPAPEAETQGEGKNRRISKAGFAKLDKEYIAYVSAIADKIGAIEQCVYLQEDKRGRLNDDVDPADAMMFGAPKPEFTLLQAEARLEGAMLLVPENEPPASLAASASLCFERAGLGTRFMQRVCEERGFKWEDPAVARWLWERGVEILETMITAYKAGGGDPAADWMYHAKQVAQLAQDEVESAELLIDSSALHLFERQP